MDISIKNDKDDKYTPISSAEYRRATGPCPYSPPALHTPVGVKPAQHPLARAFSMPTGVPCTPTMWEFCFRSSDLSDLPHDANFGGAQSKANKYTHTIGEYLTSKKLSTPLFSRMALSARAPSLARLVMSLLLSSTSHLTQPNKSNPTHVTSPDQFRTQLSISSLRLPRRRLVFFLSLLYSSYHYSTILKL